MAQQSNNDYLIRIKGDASGLTKALDDVKKKFEETDRLVERYKAQIKDAQKNNLPGIGRLTADMKGLVAQYQSNRREVANTAKEMVSQQKTIDNLVKKINAQKRVLDSTIDKFVDYRHAEQKLKDEQASQAAVVDKLREKVESLKSVLNDKDRSGLRSGAIIPDLLKAERELENAERKYQKITDAVNAAELKTQKYENIVGSQNEKLTQLEIDLDNASDKYAQLSQSISDAGDMMDETMSSLEQHSTNLGVGEEMARLASDIAAFQKQMNSGISEFGKSTPEFSAYSSSVAGLKSELEAAVISFTKLDNSSDTYDSDLEKLINSVIDLENKFKGLASAYPELSKQIEKSGAVYARQAEQAEKLDAAITALGDKISGLGKKMAGNVAKGAKNFAKSLGDIASKAIQTRKEGSTLNSITQKLGNSFNRLGSIAKRMLARMALRAVFNNIGQAMKDLALQFADFNSAMSGMGASANQLTAQIVAAFSPLIQAIAPIVNSLIGMITNLMNSITQLFAILGGQASWRKAIKTTYDYSGAMDAAGGSAASARKEAEELERQLFSFDEINKLNMPKETDTSSGGGGGGGASADESQFRWVEEALPKNDLTEWAKKLSDAFTSHDWKKLGKTVADGVNSAFSWLKDQVKWSNAGKKITEIIDGISTTFNSFITGTNWSNIGGTFGAAIDTIVKSAKTLQSSIDWTELGNAFAESLNGFFSNLSLADVGTVIVNKINNLFSTLSGFNATLNWDEISTNIADGISSLFEDFDWSGNAKALSSFVANLIGGLADVVQKTDWKALGEGIVEALESIQWKDLLANLCDLISGILVGAFEAVGGAIEKAFGNDEANKAIEETTKKIEEQNEELEKNLNLINRTAKAEVVKETYKDALRGERDAKTALDDAKAVAEEQQKEYNKIQQEAQEHLGDSPGVQAYYAAKLAKASLEMKQAADNVTELEGEYQKAQNTTRSYADELFLAANGMETLAGAHDKENKQTETGIKHNTTLGKSFKAVHSGIQKAYDLEGKYTTGLKKTGKATETETKKMTSAVSSSATGMNTAIMYKVKPLAVTIPNVFKDAGEKSTQALKDETPRAGQAAEDLGTKATNGLKSKLLLSNVSDAAAKAGNSVLTGYNSKFTQAGEGLGNASSTGLKNKLLLSNISDAAAKAGNSALTGYKNKFTAAGEGLGNASATAMKNKLTLSAIADAAAKAGNSALTGYNGKFKTAGEGLGNASATAMKNKLTLSAIADAAAKAGNTALSGYNSTYGTTGGKLGKSFADKLTTAAGGISGTTVSASVSKALKYIDLSSEGKSAGKSFADAMEKAASNITIKYKMYDTGNTSTLTVNGSQQKTPIIGLKACADGGFLDVGQLFVARERGPEMVGTIGSKNAVVNNKQIVESISAGVERAVSHAIYEAMGQNSGQQRELVVNIGAEEVYRGWLQGQKLYNKRTSPTVSIG